MNVDDYVSLIADSIYADWWVPVTVRQWEVARLQSLSLYAHP